MADVTLEDYDLLIINSDINQEVIEEVLDIDDQQIAKRLVIVINTYGGSPYVAYRAMTHLQYIYPKIDMAVPDLAMSAGTLMCLGGDKIFMHEGSCLGPLDLQVKHPSDGEQISSLDIQQACYQVFSLTQLVAGQFFKQAKGDLNLPKTEAAKIAYESAVKLVTPLVDKVDPYHLQESFRAGPISKRYAGYLLYRSVKTLAKRKEIARVLSEDYQTHGYAITKDEAKYLGLNVGKLTELDVYKDVLSRYNKDVEGVKYERVRFSEQPKKEDKSNAPTK